MAEPAATYPAVEFTALSLNQVLAHIKEAESPQAWYDSLSYREKCKFRELWNLCCDFIDFAEDMDE